MSAPWTIGQRIALGFALALLALFVVGGVAYRNVVTMTETSRALAQDNRDLAAISRLMSVMKDAETGERGFVITGLENFLEPYNQALSQLERAQQDVRDAVAGDPAQVPVADKAFGLIEARLGELKRVIDAYRQSGFEAAQKIMQGRVGKNLMDSIRAELGTLEELRRADLARGAALAGGAASVAKVHGARRHGGGGGGGGARRLADRQRR